MFLRVIQNKLCVILQLDKYIWKFFEYKVNNYKNIYTLFKYNHKIKFVFKGLEV